MRCNVSLIPTWARQAAWTAGLSAGLLVVPAMAQNDFDRLLGELTFGEAQPPSPNDAVAEPLATTVSEAAPLRMPTGVDSTPPSTPAPRLYEPAPPSIKVAEPIELVRPSAIPQPVRLMETDEAAPLPPAAPAPVPPALSFEQVFAPEGELAGDPLLGGACQGNGGPACRPHQPPVLPPPSTLLQYFRTRPCFTDVWAGYEYDRQCQCGVYHQHLHGTCECFTPRNESGCETGCTDDRCAKRPAGTNR